MLARRVWNPCLVIWEKSLKRTLSSRTLQTSFANTSAQNPTYFASLQSTPFSTPSLSPCRFYAATVPNEKLSTDANEKSQENDKKPESAPDASPNKESQAGAPNKEKQLMDDIAKLEASSKNTHDKYLRALAETENVRQRLTRQIQDAKQFGIQSFVKDLLEVSDILTKAMGTVPEEALSDEKNPHLRNLYEGLRLTEAQLSKVFKKHGLEQIEAMGAKFDPNVHEALFEAPAQQGQESGTIMAVTQTGFKLNNRTIRPARVGVAK